MVDNLTFDDGEPITQNKLQSLYTAIKTLEGQAAKASIQNTTDNTVSTPVTFSGSTGGVLLNKTYTPYPVKFNGFNFETDTVQTTTEKPVSGTRSLYIDAAHPFSPKFVIPKDPQENSWLRLWFTIRCAPKEYETWKMTQAIFRFTNGATLVKDNMIRPQRLVDGEESQRVFMDIKQPRKSFTGMELYFWNPGSTTTVYIDDISVEQFQE